MFINVGIFFYLSNTPHLQKDGYAAKYRKGPAIVSTPSFRRSSGFWLRLRNLPNIKAVVTTLKNFYSFSMFINVGIFFYLSNSLHLQKDGYAAKYCKGPVIVSTPSFRRSSGFWLRLRNPRNSKIIVTSPKSFRHFEGAAVFGCD